MLKACGADLILFNGKIITVDESFWIAEAVSVKDGKIQEVGENSEILKYKNDDTEVIDLEGKTVIPGLYDSHLHLIETGLALSLINCRTPPMISIKDIKKAVAMKVAQVKPREWILGRGWDQVKLAEHKNPTRWDFDDVAPENPVVLTRTCGHILMANSMALEIAGITKDTPQPIGGQIVKNMKGEPTGILEESPAMNIVRQHIPKNEIPKITSYIKKACKAFNKVGITSVIDAGNNEDQMVAYQKVKEEDKLTVRVNMMLTAIKGNEPIEKSLERIKEFPILGRYGDDLLRFQGLKIFIDGGIGGRTALLRKPYENDPEDYGLLTVPVDNLQKLVDAANLRGMLCGVHCAGGKAMDIVLDVFEKTNKLKPISGRRYYLIHAYQPSEENLKKCFEMGVCVASQPSFLYYLGDSFYENIGHKRSKWIKPHRTWLDNNILVAAGTDSPVTPYSPFPSLWASITRRTEINNTLMGAAQKVTREDALKMYTINGAYLTFEEDLKGSLEPGKLADMVIIDKDILSCSEDDIKEIKVLRTFLGGKTVFTF
jgi:predicted amidohydrolase YtcJ